MPRAPFKVSAPAPRNSPVHQSNLGRARLGEPPKPRNWEPEPEPKLPCPHVAIALNNKNKGIKLRFGKDRYLFHRSGMAQRNVVVVFEGTVPDIANKPYQFYVGGLFLYDSERGWCCLLVLSFLSKLFSFLTLNNDQKQIAKLSYMLITYLTNSVWQKMIHNIANLSSCSAWTQLSRFCIATSSTFKAPGRMQLGPLWSLTRSWEVRGFVSCCAVAKYCN